MTPSAERQLLRAVGDQQLKYCPPKCFWPCETIETDVMRYAVLHRFRPVVGSDGAQSFLQLCVWASDARGTLTFSAVFSLN